MIATPVDASRAQVRLGVVLLVVLALVLPLIKPAGSVLTDRGAIRDSAAALVHTALHQQHLVVLRHGAGQSRVALRQRDIVWLAVRWNATAVVAALFAAVAVALRRRHRGVLPLPRSIARGAPLAPRAPPAIAV